MSLDRPIPATGDRFRHFKGTSYVVIAVAYRRLTQEKLVVYADKLKPLPLIAKHTESGEELMITTGMHGNDEAIVAVGFESNGQIQDAWARPLNNFMEILSNGQTSYYRFDKIN